MKRLILRRVFKAPEPPAPVEQTTPVTQDQFVSVGARHFRTYGSLEVGDRFSPQLEGWENAIFVYSGNGISRSANDGARQEAQFGIDTVCLLVPAPTAYIPFQNIRIGSWFRIRDMPGRPTLIKSSPTTFRPASNPSAGPFECAEETFCEIVETDDSFILFQAIPVGATFRSVTDGPLMTKHDTTRATMLHNGRTLYIRYSWDTRCQLATT